jgi:DeoR/GlpR family transcriptional regulator of sugar metabolism
MSSSMTPIERRKHILDLIEKRNSISVGELCQLLGVSDMTIRRDLRSLSNAGLLERVYGGALLRRGRSYEPPYLTRIAENIEKKEIIGRRAASLVDDGDSIALDVGTTTFELAKCLRSASNLTIITASVHIANVLNEAPSLRLILTGGILRTQELSLIGHIAERAFRDFNVDKAFVGVGGLDFKDGLTEYNVEDMLVKRAMIENADQVIVVADSSKLGKNCFATIAPLSVVDILVTDSGIPEEFRERLTGEGIQVIIA